ncbi:MAG: ATP-binding protein [Deltaproteobacteria bacterium]|nr:ATP-binding protein [Deltaproteobacteria bacterium]
MYPRLIAASIAGSKKSVLLLGPRQTGKSTLMRGLGPEMAINLERETEFLAFAGNPAELEQRLAARPATTVFIDEVQRLPSMLNTIQAILDETPRPPKFLLTGSSARKLRRGQANLLPGRIHHYLMGPIVAAEADYALDTKTVLAIGSLPGILSEPDGAQRRQTLRSYAATYVREEVQAEGLTRNIEGFSRFILLAAAMCTHFLDHAKLSREAAVARQSSIRFFEILEDTLIVRRCEAFTKSLTRRLVSHPRYFFYDNGVLCGLLNNFEPSADRVGALFENLVFTQLVHSAAARGEEILVTSYRTEHGAEVDFIVEYKGSLWAVEVKATANLSRSDLTGLRSFAEYYGRPHQKVIAVPAGTPKVIEGVSVLPWQSLLKEIGL